MARPTRKNSVARWIVAIAAGVATIGFWNGVLNNALPASASSPTTQTVQAAPAPVQRQFGSRQQLAAPSFSQPQVSMQAPRLRTRGS